MPSASKSSIGYSFCSDFKWMRFDLLFDLKPRILIVSSEKPRCCMSLVLSRGVSTSLRQSASQTFGSHGGDGPGANGTTLSGGADMEGTETTEVTEGSP